MNDSFGFERKVGFRFILADWSLLIDACSLFSPPLPTNFCKIQNNYRGIG
jgi:hypothetical protein